MRKCIWTIVICTIIFTITFCLTGIVEHDRTMRLATPSTPTQEIAASNHAPEPEPVAITKTSYTVREYEGAVSVFTAAEDAPLIITEIEVSGLRSVDQKMIREGITLASYEDVLMLLEDLGS